MTESTDGMSVSQRLRRWSVDPAISDSPQADCHLAAGHIDELCEALEGCRQACLFEDDDGGIGVTEDPHIPSELFDKICIALNRATAKGDTKEASG